MVGASPRNKEQVTRFNELRVLVADGNRHMRTLLLALLHAFGIRNVRDCLDGSEAMKILEEWPADVLITEIDMTPLTGIELIRLLRRDEGRHQFLAVIVLTGHCEKPVVMAARDAGADEFLAKPVTAQQLLARLNEVVLRRRKFVRTKSFFGPDRRRRPGRSPGDKERRAAAVAALPNDKPLTQEEIGLVLDE